MRKKGSLNTGLSVDLSGNGPTKKNGPHVWRLSEVILLLKTKQPVDVFKFYKRFYF